MSSTHCSCVRLLVCRIASCSIPMPDIRCGSTYAAVCIRGHSGKDPCFPTVSIILAVHNGAALLRQKVAHLLSLDYPQDRMEIEIVSDGSTDGTDDILEEIQNPQVKSLPMFRASRQGGGAEHRNAERHR